MKSPRVVFGCPLYNNAKHLPQALESILSQSYRDFGIILVDDCSSDNTPEVVARYANRDSRILHTRNARRLGYIGNARRCFDLAREQFPTFEYFAWASDHDVWHPTWLECLVKELDVDPGIVLAYPQTVRIDDTGIFRWIPRRFDTSAIVGAPERLRAAFLGMAAGDMIYGLFLRSALERVNGLAPVLLPDRLLLSELALYGRFKQVPAILWYRRYWGLASYDRQRAAFFPDGYPAYSYLPWWLVHAWVLFRRLVVEQAGHPTIGAIKGFRMTLTYVALALAMQFQKRLHGLRWLQKAARRGRKLTRSRVSSLRKTAGRIRKTAVRAYRSRVRTSGALTKDPNINTSS